MTNPIQKLALDLVVLRQTGRVASAPYALVVGALLIGGVCISGCETVTPHVPVGRTAWQEQRVQELRDEAEGSGTSFGVAGTRP